MFVSMFCIVHWRGRLSFRRGTETSALRDSESSPEHEFDERDRDVVPIFIEAWWRVLMGRNSGDDRRSLLEFGVPPMRWYQRISYVLIAVLPARY